MKRSDLPKNCHKSELGQQETVTCRCNRRLRPQWTYLPAGMKAEPDPVGTLHWSCPDPLCHGPFEG